MIRRALLLSVILVALIAGPVSSQEDYDGTSGEATVLANGDIVVTGEGFEPNAEVRFEVDFTPFDSDENAAASFAGHEGEFALVLASASAPLEIVQTGTTRSDANGDVRFVVEDQGEGRYEIFMTDGVNEATVVVTKGDPAVGGDGVVPAESAGALPTTGSDSSVPFAQIGVALVMIGGVAIYGAKRRRARAFS